MIVVVKLGGSLLTLPELASKLRVVLAQRSGDRCLILTGGGASADIVREWSRIHDLNDETAHWLAVSSLDLNRKLLQTMCHWRSVSTRATADLLWTDDLSPLLLDMMEFAKVEEVANGQFLPHDWTVTSDSLAAWAAIRWPAEELVLLKSVPAPHGLTAEEASRLQLVDPHFPRLTTQLKRVLWCNLRASTIVIEPWL